MVIEAQGGLCAGAFVDGHLIGYVFGFPTREAGVQHSHRLAVLSRARGMHLGARLKWYQRDLCLAPGIDLVRRTFDPLRGLNASLTLGTIIRTYHADCYGAMQRINAGLPSDRLLADRHLKSAPVSARADGITAPNHPAVLQRLKLAEDSDVMIHNDPPRDLAERLRLREAITCALAAGHAIIGFDRAAREYLMGTPAQPSGTFLPRGPLQQDTPGRHHATAHPLSTAATGRSAMNGRLPGSGEGCEGEVGD